VGRKALENAAEQKLDGTGLGGEAGYSRDVEVSGLRPQQEVAIEVDWRL
jgi:hypothetical protein